MNRKGQGLLETVLLLPVVCAVVVGLAFVCFRSLVYYYADLQLHEALLCSSHIRQKSCEREFKKRTQKILILGQIKKFQIEKTERKIAGFIVIEFEGHDWTTIHIHKEVPLPLKAGSL